MDNYNLAAYYRWSLEPETYTIVYALEDRIFGIMTLRIRDDFVSIEMLARNSLVIPKGSGRVLVQVAENIARDLGKHGVRLDSKDTAVSFYRQLGYRQYSEAFSDAEFGLLTPMKKRLSPSV